MLLILADDMTYTDLGCFGNREVRTPHLDRLARQGMKLTRCFSPAPMCAPARTALYTGLFPVRNGAHPNHSRVRPGVKSLPHFLKPLGYRVGLLGKRHVKPAEAFPFEFLGGRHHDGGRGDDLDTAAIRRFLERDPEQPYCLVVASNQPHQPWNRGDAAAYDPQRLALPPYLVDTPATRQALARYYAEITYFDAQLGQVLAILKEHGQPRRTLVMFLSEQGSSFPHCKWTCYETGLRAAGIARWPGVVEAGSASAAMVQYVDVVPTLIEIAGGDVSQFDLDGQSFQDVLKGQAQTHRDFVYGVQTSRGIIRGPEAYGIRSVRDERYKLIWNLFPENRFQNVVTAGSEVFQSWKDAAEQGNQFDAERVRWYQHRPEFELYDLRHDPFELENLADDPKSEPHQQRLHRQLREWMRQQGDEGRVTEMQAPER
jgi:uncharacterized sulfatase